MSKLISCSVLWLSICFFACNKRIIPTDFSSNQVISIYPILDPTDEKIRDSKIDFTRISNLELKGSRYKRGTIGIVKDSVHIREVIKELSRQNKNQQNVRFLLTNIPFVYEAPRKMSYLLLAINPRLTPSFKKLNDHLLRVESHVDNENFEPCILLHYDNEGEILLSSILSNLEKEVMAYVMEDRIMDIRILKRGYHKKLAFFGFRKLEHAEDLADKINTRLQQLE